MLRVGLIGFGYWGPNLARNFRESPDCELVAIADVDRASQAAASRKYPEAAVFDSLEQLLAKAAVDLVAIAVPLAHHHSLAKAALQAGKHVLIAKPIAATVPETAELIDLAASKGLTLAVDHTFLFTGAVRKMKELLDRGDLGRIYYYDSVRVNLGVFQSDCNVVWDLATHDLAILDYLLGEPAVSVAAHGFRHSGGKQEDVAYLTLTYASSLSAHLHVNWLSPIKLRRTILAGSKQMLLWDDLDPENKIKLYDKGVEMATADEVRNALRAYRIGDMRAPILPRDEALAVEIAHLAECVRTGKKPLNSAESGLRIVKTLRAADTSLREGGRFVEIGS